MKTVPGRMQIVDAEKGDVKEERVASWQLLPPAADACQTCGHRPAHGADEPHNAQSLYYQYSFYAEHARWPTWRDAVAHCSQPVRDAWEAELRKLGVWPADEVSA